MPGGPSRGPPTLCATSPWTRGQPVMTASELVDRGAVLAGRHRVERVLRRGGMGIVVQAMHLELQQPVAVKLMLPEVIGKRRFLGRFVREVQTAATVMLACMTSAALAAATTTTVRDTAMTRGGAPGRRAVESGHGCAPRAPATDARNDLDDRVRHRARISVMSIWPTTESSL